MKNLLSLFGVLLLLLMGACGTDEPPVPEVPGPETDVGDPLDEDDLEGYEDMDDDNSGDSHDGSASSYELSDYFMPDGSTAYFEGYGNEYAQLNLRTDFLENNHVAVYEDNGGTVLLSVYRLTDNRIELVLEEGEYYEEYRPTAAELEALEPISVYLEFPIEEGQTFENQTVTETGATLETYYGTFENVFVLQERYETGGVSWTYFAEGYGEVKREYRVNEDDPDELAITSILSSIEMEGPKGK